MYCCDRSLLIVVSTTNLGSDVPVSCSTRAWFGNISCRVYLTLCHVLLSSICFGSDKPVLPVSNLTTSAIV
jgi:hypothetical protein